LNPVDPLDDDDLDWQPWTQDIGNRFIWTEVRRIDLGEESPFLTIWTRPRQTIRAIVETDPTRHVVTLAVLQGVTPAALRASTRKLGDGFSFPMVLTLVIVLGSSVALAGLYLVGWLLALVGRWLGSRARPVQIRAAIARSEVPTIAGLPIGILLLAVLGRELFTTRMPTIVAHPALGLLLQTWHVVTALLRGWSLMLLVKCLGEVQRVSAWRGLGSLLPSVAVKPPPSGVGISGDRPRLLQR
jgi:hypothetical protein